MTPWASFAIKTTYKYLLQGFGMTTLVLYTAQPSKSTHERFTFVPILMSNLEKNKSDNVSLLHFVSLCILSQAHGIYGHCFGSMAPRGPPTD